MLRVYPGFYPKRPKSMLRIYIRENTATHLLFAIQQTVAEGYMRSIPVPEYMRTYPPFPGRFRIPALQRIEGKYRYWWKRTTRYQTTEPSIVFMGMDRCKMSRNFRIGQRVSWEMLLQWLEEGWTEEYEELMLQEYEKNPTLLANTDPEVTARLESFVQKKGIHKRMRRGDILEFFTEPGFAYAQYMHDDRSFSHDRVTPICRFLPGIYKESLSGDALQKLVAGPDHFQAIVYLPTEFRDHAVLIVDNLPVPWHARRYPLFKQHWSLDAPDFDSEHWVLRGKEGDVTERGRLDVKHKDLPFYTLSHYEEIIDWIQSGEGNNYSIKLWGGKI